MEGCEGVVLDEGDIACEGVEGLEEGDELFGEK